MGRIYECTNSGIAMAADLAAGLGLLDNARTLYKFGRHRTVDPGDAPKDVVVQAGLYGGFPAAAGTIEVVSDDANDTDGGTGARTVRLDLALDANGNELPPIDLALDGVTPVVHPTQQVLRCSRARVLTAGSNGGPVGTLTVRQTGAPAVVFVQLNPGQNRSFVAAYTVPVNKYGVIRKLYAAVNREGAGAVERDADLELLTRSTGADRVWEPRFEVPLTPYAPLNDDAFGGLSVEPLDDIVWRITSVSTASTHVSAGFGLFLLDL